MTIHEWLRGKYLAMQHRSSWSRRDDESFEHYFAAATDNRRVIRDALTRLSPRSIYEYGCYSGPNLRGFDCDVLGSDINPKAIAFARRMLPKGRFIEAGSLRALAKWLPGTLDVSLVNAVFYTMERSSVDKVLQLLARRSRIIVVGDNFDNSWGADSQLHDRTFVHACNRILEPVGVITD
jgi:SAM-dependent methyltransferase